MSAALSRRGQPQKSAEKLDTVVGLIAAPSGSTGLGSGSAQLRFAVELKNVDPHSRGASAPRRRRRTMITGVTRPRRDPLHAVEARLAGINRG